MRIDTIECQDCGHESIDATCPTHGRINPEFQCSRCGWSGDAFPIVGGSLFCPGCVEFYRRLWGGR